jgi:hypothetical protein
LATREEAQAALARVLMEHVRHDKHPSVTHMMLLEQIIPQSLLPEYIDILLEKVLTTRTPSIPMLQRIARVSQRL